MLPCPRQTCSKTSRNDWTIIPCAFLLKYSLKYIRGLPDTRSSLDMQTRPCQTVNLELFSRERERERDTRAHLSSVRKREKLRRKSRATVINCAMMSLCGRQSYVQRLLDESYARRYSIYVHNRVANHLFFTRLIQKVCFGSKKQKNKKGKKLQ